jgi:MFS family permease
MYPKIFYILCVVGFLMTVLFGMSTPILPLFAQIDLQASAALIGLVVASFSLFRIFFELPFGYISDKIGRRIPIIASLFITVTAAISCGFVLDSYQLILARALWGLGSSFFYSAASSLLMDVFDPQIRGKALGILVGMETGGSLFGSLLGGYLVDLLGDFRLVFFISGIILIPAIVPCFLSKELKALGSKERIRTERESSPNSFKSLKSLRLIFVCVIAFLIFLIYQGIIVTILPLYARNDLRMDYSLIGILMSAAGIGLFLSPFMAGFVSEKIGRTKFLFTAIIFLSISMYLLSFARSFESLLPLLILAGFAKGCVLALGPIMAVEATNFMARGAAIGAYRTSFGIGNVVGPVVIAVLAASSIPLAYNFAAIAALVTLVPVMAFSAQKARK